ncbi:MAG: hypothetical protein H6608_00855 [Flavobacteriales bacterium]|nr:hypothetical protein [Flavobacteriales bacterium]
MNITAVDRVWTCITYFEVEGIFYYITFIIDNYSRRIVGHHTSARLKTEHTSLRALKMAYQMRYYLRAGVPLRRAEY